DGMIVKPTDLADDGGANEMIGRGVLRARLQAAATRDAAGERIGDLLLLLLNRRPGAQVVCAVDRNPRLGALEVVEQPLAVDEQVAHQRELAYRFQRDRLLKLVDQRRARLPRSAV